MKHPSIFIWIKRWFFGSFIIFTVIAAGLVIVNIVDAYPYWRALHRIRALDEPTLRMIANLCTTSEKRGHQRLTGNDIPPELRFLKPVRVSFYPGCSDIALLEPDDPQLIVYAYVFLRVGTHAEDQTIIAVNQAFRGQHSKLLWEKNPAYSQQFCFNNRVATLTQREMHSARDWIFLPGELVIVDHPYQVGRGSKIVKRIPINATQRTKINEAIFCIDSELRGHAFDSGGCDGITLHISFTPDGSLGDGVILANAWRKEATPLIEALISILGEEESTEIRSTVEWLSDSQRSDYVRSYTVKEYQEDRERSWLPWWRLWPRCAFLENKNP